MVWRLGIFIWFLLLLLLWQTHSHTPPRSISSCAVLVVVTIQERCNREWAEASPTTPPQINDDDQSLAAAAPGGRGPSLASRESCRGMSHVRSASRSCSSMLQWLWQSWCWCCRRRHKDGVDGNLAFDLLPRQDATDVVIVTAVSKDEDVCGKNVSSSFVEAEALPAAAATR